MGERPIEDLNAGDAFRNAMVHKADLIYRGRQLWHGWVIMDAFLAGIDYARSQATPDVSGKLKEALADPNTVHLNMLRGGIARPSLTQFLHVMGNGTLDAFREVIEIAARNESCPAIDIARQALSETSSDPEST